ncbi:Boron transporter 1 [Hibiscus syriacus]|uniref:Boron transporter 1 n=1 Tax=Hibiscus syriacus TaxID=106335 RepID=A0A6A3C6G6_HIBSY|nr:Boron transporter 1 [Hibiscus syriacus]
MLHVDSYVVIRRWSSHGGSNLGIEGTLRYHTLDHRRSTVADIRSCRANCHYGMRVDCRLVVLTVYIGSLFHYQQVYTCGGRTVRSAYSYAVYAASYQRSCGRVWIPQHKNPKLTEFIPSWRFANGMFALVLSFGLLFSALRSRNARSWCYGTGSLKSFIAYYGVPFMVLVWTAVSYIPSGSVPKGVRRRLFSPNPWSPDIVMWSYWIPPENGVIPQSPMHTKSLATLKHQRLIFVSVQLLRNRLVATARNSIKKNASLGQLYGNMQEAYQQMQTPLVHQEPAARGLHELKESTIQAATCTGHINTPIDETLFDIEKEINDLLPVEVKEQRLSNLLQSTMVGGCVAAMPILKMIATSVLWGYFAFRAI